MSSRPDMPGNQKPPRPPREQRKHTKRSQCPSPKSRCPSEGRSGKDKGRSNTSKDEIRMRTNHQAHEVKDTRNTEMMSHCPDTQVPGELGVLTGELCGRPDAVPGGAADFVLWPFPACFVLQTSSFHYFQTSLVSLVVVSDFGLRARQEQGRHRPPLNSQSWDTIRNPGGFRSCPAALFLHHELLRGRVGIRVKTDKVDAARQPAQVQAE